MRPADTAKTLSECVLINEPRSDFLGLISKRSLYLGVYIADSVSEQAQTIILSELTFSCAAARPF